MISLLIKNNEATLIFRLPSVVSINVLQNCDFELNLYPAQEEGFLFCQILHSETELKDLSQNEDSLLCLL